MKRSTWGAGAAIAVAGVPIVKAGLVNPGTTVSLAGPSGGAPFASWVIGDPPRTATYFVPETASDPSFLNTGNQFFLDRAVGFDLLAGTIIVPGGLAATGGSAPWMPWLAFAALMSLAGGVLVVRLGMDRAARRLYYS